VYQSRLLPRLRRMARPLIIEFAGALYHCTARGDRQELIHEDQEDRQGFLRLLGEVVEESNWLCRVCGRVAETVR